MEARQHVGVVGRARDRRSGVLDISQRLLHEEGIVGRIGLLDAHAAEDRGLAHVHAEHPIGGVDVLLDVVVARGGIDRRALGIELEHSRVRSKEVLVRLEAENRAQIVPAVEEACGTGKEQTRVSQGEIESVSVIAVLPVPKLIPGAVLEAKLQIPGVVTELPVDLRVRSERVDVLFDVIGAPAHAAKTIVGGIIDRRASVELPEEARHVDGVGKRAATGAVLPVDAPRGDLLGVREGVARAPGEVVVRPFETGRNVIEALGLIVLTVFA